MDKRLKVLVGAEVNFVRFGPQIDINFYGGVERDLKYADLQLEAPFTLQAEDDNFTVKPGQKDTEAPLLAILNTKVVSIELTSADDLTVTFSNGMAIFVSPIRHFESWNLTGHDLPHYIARPL